MPKGKPYSEEFKQGAPKLVSEQRLRPSKVARGLGSLSTRNSASKSASGSFLLYQFVSAPPNGLFVIGRGAHVRYRTLSITSSDLVVTFTHFAMMATQEPPVDPT